MLKRRGVIARWEPKRNAPKDFCLLNVFREARAATAANSESPVYARALALEIDSVSERSPMDWSVKARFFTLRNKEEKPVSYSPGADVSSIDIPDDSYIADVMHMIVMSNGCLVFERHKNGPTLGALSEYLLEHLRAQVRIVSLYNRDLVKELAELSGRLRRVEISFLSEKVGTDGGGLLGNLKALSLGERVPSISVSLSVGRTRNKESALPDDLQHQALELASNAGELIERMKLSGYNEQGERREVNVLRQRIGHHMEFRPDARVHAMPDAADAYEKLHKMYRQNEDAGVIESALRPEFLAS